MNTADKLNQMNTPMNRQLIMMFGMIVVIHLIGKINFEDPTNKMYLFIAYGCSQGLTLLVAGLIYLKIKQKNEQGILHIKNTGMVANAQAAVDKDGEIPEVITQTIMEYDMSKVKQMFGNVAITVALSCFLYYKFNAVKPLAVQSIFAIKNIIDQPLVKIHLLNKPATGDLARPFKPANFLAPKEEAITDKDFKRMEKKKN